MGGGFYWLCFCFTVKYRNNPINQVPNLQKSPKSNQHPTFYTLSCLQQPKYTALSSCHNTLLLNNTLATKYGGLLLREVHKIITSEKNTWRHFCRSTVFNYFFQLFPIPFAEHLCMNHLFHMSAFIALAGFTHTWNTCTFIT